MSDAAEPENEKAPWTIKGVLVSDRKLATDTATKTGQTVAACMADAIRHWAKLVDGNVLPPPDQRQANLSLPAMDIGGLAVMLQAATAAAASAGIPVQKRVVRGAFSILDSQLRAANGQSALPPRKPSVRRITLQGLPENRPSLPQGKPQ